MAIALRYTEEKRDAEEVVNDGFLKAFAKMNQYDDRRPFKNWLASIVVHTAIDLVRKNKRQWSFDLLTEDQVLNEEDNPLFDSDQEKILPLLQSLPPQYRLVFNLYVFEEYKHAEIAQLLHISVGTSKSNYSRARNILKNKLTPNQIKMTV